MAELCLAAECECLVQKTYIREKRRVQETYKASDIEQQSADDVLLHHRARGRAHVTAACEHVQKDPTYIFGIYMAIPMTRDV